jgi:leucyl-tRNA synthetase
MSDRYEPKSFEAKWQRKWESAELFKTREDDDRPKFYALDFFPYPSGAGLSVGHCRNYIPTDVLARMKVMQGYCVLHPMGFDAFGLPAENEAIKNKTHPAPMIERYAATYRRQMSLVGISFDWSRSFKSCDPSYYKWTQWFFKLLYKRGLAYQKLATVNWDPVDKTVLADEEVIGGRAERSGALVEKKSIPQWFFKITDYAQRLIDDLDELDWPEGIKNQQRNWIGRSEGVEFEFTLDLPPASGQDSLEVVHPDKPLNFRVFTTRIDTVFGVSFCVLSPEHPILGELLQRVSKEDAERVRKYQEEAAKKTDAERTADDRTKTGVFTGAYAINPFNGKKIPVWVADYVLAHYGTGAIMAVPAHDQRDYDFAKQYGLEIIPVIKPTEEYLASIGVDLATYLTRPADFSPVFESKDSVMINSGEYDGLTFPEGVEKLGKWLESRGIGERKVQYKLRDWLISRQRYWGCPIPVIHTQDGAIELVPDESLPVYLPEVENYEPSDDGSSPLSRIPEFVNVSDQYGRLAKRETDTMGGFACSSWYFLRFCDPHNHEKPFDVEKVKKWMPVDCYVGGAEHAVMHLLYARFWTKVLYDEGLIPFKEPFQRLKNQGQVLGLTAYRYPREGEVLGVGEEGILVSNKEAESIPDDQKFYRWARMSKSKGNVVTPEEAVENYGADALRIYELFVAPFEADVQWSNDGMNGAVRFLNRVFKLVDDLKPVYNKTWQDSINGIEATGQALKVRKATHKAIQKITEDIERFAFNTYISSLMIYINTLTDILKEPGEGEAWNLALSEAVESLVLLLAPAAPHSADELWETLGNEGFTYNASWPKAIASLTVDDEVTIAVQVNGKLRDTVVASASATDEELTELAKSSEKVQGYLQGVTIRKVIVVKGKLVNIVAN